MRQKDIHLSSEELEPNLVRVEPWGLPGWTESEEGTRQYRTATHCQGSPRRRETPLSGATDSSFQMQWVSKKERLERKEDQMDSHGNALLWGKREESTLEDGGVP